jgi:[ribosomal protein S5]-alanine N-acetyltransferase
MFVQILPFSSDNFTFQNLEPNQEKLKNYLSWMRDIKNNIFIESIDKSYSLEKLSQFIDEKNNSSEALLLGIFDNNDGTHFGNIKFEPINIESKTAWLGILIGDLRYRGKGYAKEIIDSTCKHILNNFEISKIYLGVDKNNFVALKAYLKCNFIIHKESSHQGLILIRQD